MGSKCSPMYFMGENLLKVRCMSGRGPDTALSHFSISCESHSQAGSACRGHNKVNARTLSNDHQRNLDYLVGQLF